MREFYVYEFLSDSGDVLYIGKTLSLAHRVSNHSSKKWFNRVDKIKINRYSSEIEQDEAEICMIKDKRPIYNKQVLSVPIVLIDITDQTVLDIKKMPYKYFVWDRSLKGFGVCVNPKGANTFIVQFRDNNKKTVRKKINAQNATSARKEADYIISQRLLA